MSDILEQLTLDQTFFTEFFIFFIVFAFLTLFFFNPFLKHLEARYERTTLDKESAQQMMEKFSEQLKSYESSMRAAHQQAQGLIQKALQESKQRENEILFKAREDSRKRIQETHLSLGQEKSLVRAQVKAELEQLANALTNQLLAK